jgi:hypothetical protein
MISRIDRFYYELIWNFENKLWIGLVQILWTVHDINNQM